MLIESWLLIQRSAISKKEKNNCPQRGHNIFLLTKLHSISFKNEEQVCFRPAVSGSCAGSDDAEGDRPCLLSSLSHHRGPDRPHTWCHRGSLKRENCTGLRVKNLSTDRPLAGYHQSLRRWPGTPKGGIWQTDRKPSKTNHAVTGERLIL